MLAAGRSGVPHAVRKVLHGLHPPVLGGLPFLRNGGEPDIAAAGGRPSGRRWPFRSGWVDAAWVVFSATNLCAMAIFSHWETVPFHFIWISLTILYGFRVWTLRSTLWVLIAVMACTGAVWPASSLRAKPAGISIANSASPRSIVRASCRRSATYRWTSK